MSTPFKGITIHEGYNEIGTFEVNITSVETPTTALNYKPEYPQNSRKLLFRFQYESTEPVTQAYVGNFTVLGRDSDEDTEYMVQPNAEGFVEIDTPLFPVVVIPDDPEDTILRLDVNGPLNERAEECYIKVYVDPSTSYYTLIWDVVIHDGKLAMKGASDIFYRLDADISVSEDITAIHVTEIGAVFGFDSVAEEWTELGTLEFSMIEYPDKLESVEEGFYKANVDTGTITTGELGSGAFEDYSVNLLNPGIYLVDVNLEVSVESDGVVYTGSFTNLMPGNLNINIITVDGSAPIAEDLSPTIEEIQTIGSFTLSEGFVTFLTTRGLTTIDKIRKAGPIVYIDGFNPEQITNNTLSKLQGHVMLYTINQDAVQNQRIISQGYKTILAIAFVPMKNFVNAVVNDDLSLFQAAKIHELAVQNQKLASNLMGGAVMDLKRKSPSTPQIPGSNFVENALSKVLNTCGCDDCKSVISPFMYLLDLLKYGATNVNYIGSPVYYPGSSLANFITLMSNKFLQPFGTLDVDCKTLHDEFCRVRLVTEILEAKVAASTIPEPQLTNLGIERNQFLQLVYQTILSQAGSSFNEVRNVYLTSPADDKLLAAQKLANKLGIPLYLPSTTDYTTDVLWLTLNNANPDHELNAANLEEIFGFRDTQRNVLTDTPVSLMEDWHANYLRDFWRTQDYVLSNYSREGVIPGTPATYKTNWMPIIDPDFMGWEDMTYLGSSAAKALWNNRKTQTDVFLLSCVDNSALSVTRSADINARILRVVDRNLVSQSIEDNTIYISKLVGMSVLWYDFIIDKRTLNQTDTDISIVQSSDPVFDSYTETMKYNRELPVSSFPTPAAGVPFTLSWSDAVFSDATGAVIELKSSGNATVFESGTDFSFTIQTNKKDIEITFVSAITAPGWLTGNITLVCETEVNLSTTTLINPALLVLEMLTPNSQSYNALSPAVISPNPYPYSVWDNSTVTDYTDAKILYADISSGTATPAQLLVVKDELYLSITEFNRLMVLLANSERYLQSIYSVPKPTIEEQYEIASIFCKAGKKQQQAQWVIEEINYIETGITPINLMLSGQYFWKSLKEPAYGAWDPSLQTIPDTFGALNPAIHKPIINPLYLNRNDLCVHPTSKQYMELYDARKARLDLEYNTMLDFIVPYSYDGFTKILNYINTGNSATPYDINPPYASYADLITDLISQDPFLQKKAGDVVYSAFGVSASDFIQVNTIKDAYENVNASNIPASSVLAKAVRLLLPGYARLQLYFAATTGWIDEEITGDFTGGDSEMVYYYNALKMKLAPGRGDASNRKEWQSTLANWNRQAFIQPDLMPPENILNFVSTNPVYDIWNTRNTALLNAYTTIATNFNSGENAGDLFDDLKAQLNLLVARVNNFTYITPQIYLPYFLEIETIDANGDDIRPALEQLGIKPTEYRYLINIYNVLQATTPSDPSPLVATEYDDVINIIIAIRSRNLSFEQVQEEYTGDILLDQDYFLIYKPALVSFPLVDLPVYNEWRSPQKEMKAWKDILQGRIDMEQGVIDRWKEVLKEAEDRNMPLMRDALIRSLTGECELWQDVSEQLAKTYFIETKDNCCVKHTRVSFAIETLQGFLLALQNGIYDGFVADFSLQAPAFEREWKWLGSYATWRAAIFVYIYPENLLYPTLKRLQSPTFIKLADTVQNANRFTPQNACDTGKEFQTYVDDLKSLEVCCTVNTSAKVSLTTPGDCCTSELLALPDLVYYFGKGKSGASYWTHKEMLDTSADALEFWEELPIRKESKLVGCFAYSKRPSPASAPDTVSLYLFYSYSDNGKFKMSYIKKDIYDVNSVWSDETETDDFPEFTSDQTILKVTACQTRLDTKAFSFVISYSVAADSNKGQTVRDYDPEKDSWTVPKTTVSNLVGAGSPGGIITHNVYSTNNYTILTEASYPLDCIQFDFQRPGSQSLNGYAYVFEKQIIIQGYDSTELSNATVANFYKIKSAFQSAEEPNTLIVFHQDAAGNNLIHKVTAYVINSGLLHNQGYNVIINTTGTVLTGTGTASIFKSYPVFSLQETVPRHLAFMTISGSLRVGAQIFAVAGGSTVTVSNHFALTPENLPSIAVQSAECIGNMGIRATSIKLELQANTNAPIGTSVNNIVRQNKIAEVLNEAYYFVPMLLALDQQKRGEYPTALNWYRSVYDYTQALTTNRKIFYGLVLEETITNVYSHTPQWLLDPLNPHLIAQSRANAYTKYTVSNIVQCMFAYADREFTMDTIETVPVARRLYTEALELLQIPDIQLKANGCESISEGCLDTRIEIMDAPAWRNLFSSLKQKLRKLGNTTLIESIEDDIVDLINSGDESTYAEKFSEAFELIITTTPSPTTPLTVTEQFDEMVKDNSYTHSYIYALSDHRSFNKEVERNFTAMVTSITGITEEELHTEEGEGRMAWITTELPENSYPYKFLFMDDETGVQRMQGSNRYNPLSPSRKSYDANMVYTNAKSVYYREKEPMPVEFMPLLSFRFCMPENPVYDSLELKGNVELYKIHNCRNIAGMVRELDAYAAATDSVTGMPFIGASGNLVTPGIGNYPPSQYRFKTLIERAKQIASQAQQMESLFLAALEKLDAENYNQLRARQDLQTAKATVKLQNLRITQAIDEKGAATIQLDKATFTQDHYNDLISAGQNAYEVLSLVLLAVAATSQAAAGAIASSTADVASGASYSAQSIASLSSIASQMASYQRRQEEWGFQKDLAGFDIQLANQQIKIAEDNVRIVTQERDIAQMNTEHAQDSLEFLKTKFTNAELYNYMSNVLERSYSYMLNLATSTAKVAENQLYFERQEQTGPFILDDYWESPNSGSAGGSTDRRGLTGSARLTVDITRLDEYAFETNKRKLQMTKVISLAQNFPSEFQQFKETGVINFALTNKMFDYDFPGHYLRLINSVKTTVVGLLPVYDNIKATLTSAATSYTVIGGTIFQRAPIRRGINDSVALTSANNATGIFEMQPMQNSELLNPFENMGIESQWEFKMPRFSNHMDYSNIADVLLTVEYTALDSFVYRTQVLQDLDNSLTFNRGFSFKNNFPDQWYELAQAEQGSPTFEVTVELKREMFPQGILDLKLNAATGVSLYFTRAEGFTQEISVADFNLVSATAAGAGGDTVNGVLRASPIINSNPTPLMKLKLSFENTAANRQLFSEGNVTDILVLVGCKAELPVYPL